MQLAVCDDNALFLKEIGAQLRALDMAEDLQFYSDLERFWTCVEEGAVFDAVLMDIDWRQSRTGMDTAEQLYRALPDAKIIYVTGYNDRFSQHIFLHRSNLSGYLTKPVDPELLRANLQKVADGLLHREDDGLLLRANGAGVRVPFREISYIESRDHVVTVHTRSEAVSAYLPLRELAEQLPGGFFQCHKSFVVNLRQIRRFQFPDILMKDGRKVPVSRARYAQVKTAYFQFMGEQF